jgi:hypothetical protein
MKSYSKKGIVWVLAAGLLSVSIGAARAEESGVPAEAKRFQMLVGKWKGSGTLVDGGKPIKLSLSLGCSRAAAGWGVTCAMRGKGKGVELHENDLMGVDPVTGIGHWFAVTNMGETHDHHVKWIDERTFQGRYGWRQDGKSLEENITVQSHGGNGVEFRSVVTADGAEVGSFSGKLAR